MYCVLKAESVLPNELMSRLVCLKKFPVTCQTEVTDRSKLFHCFFFISNNESTLFQHGKLYSDACWSFVINHTHINNEVPPWYALLGGVAGTIDAKILLLDGTAKFFEGKE